MSKKDGKVYIILYRVGSYVFHLDYVYRTLAGLMEAIPRIERQNAHMKNITVIVVCDGQEDTENYVVDGVLIPITAESTLLYG